MADNPATAQQMAEQIESQAEFGRELTALRERAGLRVRDVARQSGIPVSTVGDYFSGRHLPADPQQLIRILEVCGETDQDRKEHPRDHSSEARRGACLAGCCHCLFGSSEVLAESVGSFRCADP